MALWSDLAEWRGPTNNKTVGGMNRYDGQVTHIAAGYYEGTIAWQRNDSSNVSSHFVVGREWGQCAQLVDLDDAAWTQSDGNGEWISVENEGFLAGDRLWQPGWEQLSPWQIECNARLYARGHQEFGWPLQLTNHPAVKGLGYHSMGAEQGFRWGHSSCPGEPIKAQLPQILARAIEIVNGDDMSWDETIGADYAPPGYGEHKARTALGYAWRAANEAMIGVARLEAVVAEIAKRVDIDPDELDAVKAAAAAGAEAGVVQGADELAAAIVAQLPETGLTRADVEAAVRTVLRSVPAE